MTKILIVDDDKEITSLFQSYLLSEGYKVVSVNQSSKAVEIALEFKPDFFILDLMMPDPDGFKVCRMLRKIPAFWDKPILIVTALNDEDSRVVSFGAGADDFLSKPFKIGELGTRVKKLLAKKNPTLDTTQGTARK
jgi:DNA-binding response OmpR family regulator